MISDIQLLLMGFFLGVLVSWAFIRFAFWYHDRSQK